MSKKKLSEKEVFDIILDKIKPSIIPLEDYNKFKIYRNRHDRGELSEKARNTLFAYFGYAPECVFTYEKKNDRSLTKE